MMTRHRTPTGLWVRAGVAPSRKAVGGTNTPPTAVSSLTGTPGPTSVALSWVAATDPDGAVVGYEIRRNGVVVGTTIGTTYTAGGLTMAVSYTFSVTAVDDFGAPGPSSSVVVVTTPGTSVQAPPTNLMVFTGAMSATLTWTTPTTGVVTSYKVYRDGVLTATTTATSIAITGLSLSTVYVFGVEAVSASATSTRVTVTGTTTSGTPTEPSPATTSPTGALTTHTGDLVLTANGASTQNVFVTGHMYVAASDVDVRNCKVGGNLYLNQVPGGNPVRDRARQTLTGVEAKGLFNYGGLESFSLLKSRLGGMVDGFGAFTAGTWLQLVDEPGRLTRDLTIQECLFDRLGPYTGNAYPHFEALHVFGIDIFDIRWNSLHYEAPDVKTRGTITATMTFERSFSTSAWCRNGVFSDNWVYGGGYYQMYNSSQNCAYDRNAWHSYEGFAGVSPTPAAGTTFTQTGNTLDGFPVTLATP